MSMAKKILSFTTEVEEDCIILRFTDRETFNRINEEMGSNPALIDIGHADMIVKLEKPFTQKRYWVFGGNDIYEAGDFANDLQFCTDDFEEACSELHSEWNRVVDTLSGVVYIESNSSQADIIHKHYNDAGFVICEIYEAKAINPLGMCSAAQMIDCIAGLNEEVSPLEESWSSFLGLEDNSYKDTPIGEKLSAMLMQAYESFAIENNLPIWYTCDMKECVAKVIVT